jgi:hypothetical protein
MNFLGAGMGDLLPNTEEEKRENLLQPRSLKLPQVKTYIVRLLPWKG